MIPFDDTPFRILIIGDFTGHAPSVSDRAMEVDCDTLDQVMARLKPQLTLSTDNLAEPIALAFERLDDFHPERLYHRLGLLTPLRQLRGELLHPSTFAAAAQAVESWETWTPPTPNETIPSEPESTTSVGSDIERLFGRKAITPQGQSASLAADLIREIVGPSTDKDSCPNRDHYVNLVDQAIGETLNKILHHPDFQKLEATWRGLDFLINRIDPDVSLKVAILDQTKKDWLAEINNAQAIVDSAFYRVVVQRTVDTHGAPPWALVAIDHSLEPSDDELVCFQRCLTLARATGAPVIAGANEAFVKKAADHPLWSRLRREPEAALGGVLYPQFLLRAPYGKTTEPLEAIAFEEMSTPPNREHYLWGNPIWILTSLFGEAFGEAHWDFHADMRDTIPEIATHCYQDHGSSEQTPCASPRLAESDVSTLLKLGLMPMISIRGQNIVKIVREQSIAEPPTPLMGRWLS